MNHDHSALAETTSGPPAHAVHEASDGIAGDAVAEDLPQVVEVPEADEPREPVILIEVDPAVTGGFVRNRFDITICGRAISDVPLEETRLQVGDWVTGAAFYGQPERAPIGVMPDGRPGRQRAFRFNLPWQPDGAPERCDFDVIARTASGFEYAEHFEVDLDPVAQPPVSLASGPTRSALESSLARPYVMMYVERGTIDGDGMLSVQGWAISLGPILEINIFAGAERVATASLGNEREDVALVFPGFRMPACPALLRRCPWMRSIRMPRSSASRWFVRTGLATTKPSRLSVCRDDMRFGRCRLRRANGNEGRLRPVGGRKACPCWINRPRINRKPTSGSIIRGRSGRRPQRTPRLSSTCHRLGRRLR